MNSASINNVNDTFLYDLRQAPSQEFADKLRHRLQRQSHIEAPHRQPMLRAASFAAVLLSVTVLLTVPGVRAMAQQFLELFRVRNFVAVPLALDQDRLRRLTKGVDLPGLIGNQITQLSQPTTAQLYPTTKDAAQAAGFDIAVPDSHRSDLTLNEIKLFGAETWQVTPDTSKLKQLLDILEIRDLSIPPGLEGSRLTWTKPTHVQLSYQSSSGKLIVLQTPIPQFELPGNLDLAAFGEIGLRIFGMSPSEAHSFAQTIDWRSTFVVPIPPNAASFQQINVQGHSGLLIESRRKTHPTAASIVMWADDAFVHVVGGNMETGDLLAVANSMQSIPAQ